MSISKRKRISDIQALPLGRLNVPSAYWYLHFI
jgi:hypothetical protein